MSDLRTAAQQALEALEFMADEWGFTQKANRPERWQAITALKAALEQPEQGGKTGWPPGLLQDDCRGLSKWLASQPDARRRVREAVAALEQPEQEPVAWLRREELADLQICNYRQLGADSPRIWAPREADTPTPEQDLVPVYTHPPRREWRGLTEEEIQSVIQLEREKRFQRRPPLPLSMTELSHAIEAKLKEKNHE